MNQKRLNTILKESFRMENHIILIKDKLQMMMWKMELGVLVGLMIIFKKVFSKIISCMVMEELFIKMELTILETLRKERSMVMGDLLMKMEMLNFNKI